MIIRGQRKTKNFTVIANDVLRDDRLSYRARGLLACILSRPDNWRTSADSLAREGKEGRAAILTALKELEDAGYLVRTRVQDKSGLWRTHSTVYDEPRNITEVQFPNVGSPNFGFRTSIEELDTKKLDVAPDFEKFWNAYPRKIAKRDAQKAWMQVMRADDAPMLEQVLIAIERYKQAQKDRNYIAYPATWLRAGRWADETETDYAGSTDGERVLPPNVAQAQSFAAAYFHTRRSLDDLKSDIAHREPEYQEAAIAWFEQMKAG
jgi:hypothetical protein